MFSYIYPIFERKRLLKNEMLENLRDFPRDLFHIFYQNYSNGILTGAELSVKDDYLVLHPGILYWRGIPYVMGSSTMIMYHPTAKTSYFKVKFLEELQGAEKQEYLTRIYIDDEPANHKNEIELARFKLQEGARLRDKYTDFFDYDTEFDTINRLYAPFASPERSTIWPAAVKDFARVLVNYPITNSWDQSFCINCVQLDYGINYEMIRLYLNLRLQKKDADYSNYEVYCSLKRILHEVTGRGTVQNNEKKFEKKVLLL